MPSVAWMPFGGGTSMCPGRFVAMSEIKMFVATVLLRWEVELVTPAGGSATPAGGSAIPAGGPAIPAGGPTLEFGAPGIPALKLVNRGGLGMLAPADKIPCRWRVR